jgi:hypothetical protein
VIDTFFLLIDHSGDTRHGIFLFMTFIRFL